MHILMNIGGMPFNGDTIPSGQSLGGSESAAYYMAKEFVKLDHNVTVFTNHQQGGVWDGVRYEWQGPVDQANPLGKHYHYVAMVPHDINITQRHPLAFLRPPNSKLNFWWLHDLALIRMAQGVQAHLHNIDRVLTVSEFHKNQVSEIYGIPKESVFATHNGLDYSEYEGLPEKKEPGALVYASRPERGLEYLVKPGGIMEQLPDCHLYVCGYENTTREMAPYYHNLWQRCKDLPNVTNMGALGKRKLAELMARCMLYVYPTTFEDTSCMIALESNACGTPFIAFNGAALPETMKDAGAVLLPFNNGQVDEKVFVKMIKKLLYTSDGNPNGKWKALHEKAIAKRQTWEHAATELNDLFNNLLAEKSEDKTRLYKHLEQMSDIVALAKDAGEYVSEEIKKNYYFYFNGDYACHYDRYYQYEKDRGVNYGPEDLTGNARFEAVAEKIKELKPKSILDYGCAHGHYVMNLAARFPDIGFCGVDLNKSNLEIAKKWRDDYFTKNGSNQSIEYTTTDTFKRFVDKYDVIILGDILEHTPNPTEIVESLMKHLNEDGTIIATTPYGPWEAIGYEAHPGWRAHIHHFERQDLYEMFGSQKDYKAIAIPYGENLGNYMVTFKASGKPLGQINYDRKLKQQAPRETLSLCMIAKNEEHSIGRAIKSLNGLPDEIIVGIDETTTDETKRVVESFGAKTFEMKSPIEVGFDEARNETIKRAVGDWILWMDGDETFEQIENLSKYLRSNCYDGYGIKQHHYGVEPAALFRTDMPVRLFRNHRGFRFYGFVHEHPEKGKMNDGPGKTAILSDVAIMHTGYSTEAIRRKRYQRNFPLMQKDRQKYPDRKLGKFLWMRDLTYQIQYQLEQNGGQLTNDMIKYANVIIYLWRDILKTGDSRLTIEGLQWYTQAVQTLGGGIEFAVNMDCIRNGAELHLHGKPMRTEPIMGLFANTTDIRDFDNYLREEKIKHFDNKYF